MHQWINHHWFRQWLLAWPVPSHYLNQWWNIFNWTPRNRLQWNFNWISYIFIQENAFETFVWKMVAILSRPQCVKCVILHHILMIGILSISSEIALWSIPQDFTDDKSTLVQVMVLWYKVCLFDDLIGKTATADGMACTGQSFNVLMSSI